MVEEEVIDSPPTRSKTEPVGMPLVGVVDVGERVVPSEKLVCEIMEEWKGEGIVVPALYGDAGGDNVGEVEVVLEGLVCKGR